jgi:hypothetical protein
MPMQKGQSSLMAKLGDKGRKAHEAHKGDDVQFGMVNLPGGISGGVAQVVSVKWAEHKEGDNKGKPYATIQAVVKSPREFKGQVIEGMRASVMIPLYDTPNRKVRGEPGTFEAWYGELLNEFRKLGVDTSGIGFEDIEAVMQSLSEAKPHTKFSTRSWQPPRKPGQKEDPEPMVFTQFDGECQPAEGTDVPASSAVEDHSGDTSSSDDLDAVVEAAMAGGDDAIEMLQRLAQEAGVAQKDVDDAKDWTEVKELIIAARGGDTSDSGGSTESSDNGDGEAGDEVSEEPKKGAIYFYQPVDPKTRKPFIDPKTKKAKKAIECEVLAVDKKAETVELLNMDDKKTRYKGVKWEVLQTEP